MSPPTAILGGGLSALSLGFELLSQGVSGTDLILIDDSKERRGSNAPGALMHPFPGRSMSPSKDLHSIWSQSLDFLNQLEFLRPGLSQTVPLLRPLGHPRGERLEKSYWNHQEQLESQFGGHYCTDPALHIRYPFLGECKSLLEIPKARHVNLPLLCQTLLEHLSAQGVRRVSEEVLQLTKREETWEIQTCTQTVDARRVVFALGAGLGQFFPKLQCVPTLGTLATIHWPNGPEPDFALSMGGHIAPLSDGEWILGATYHRPPYTLPSPEQLAADLLDPLRPWIPDLENATLLRTWSGFRGVIEPSRKPVCGPIPSLKGCFVLGGFGSKGLLFVPALARQLATTLLHGKPLAESHLSLLDSPHKWLPSPGKIQA